MPILTDQDFANAKRDISDIDKALNTKAVVTPRYGASFKSLPLAVQEVIETGGFEPFATEAALLASRPVLTKKASIALDTFNIWLWENGTWSNKGGALDSLRINKNKTFPLQKITRNSVSTEKPRPEFSASLLQSVVYGSKAGELYRIAIMQNGDTSTGSAQGIQLEVLNESTVETSGSATIINARTSSNQLTLNYAKGGIQTVDIVPELRTDLLFKLTFDVDYLNSIYGSAILSATAASAGYNYIIDKSQYVNQDRLNKIFNSDSISINQGKSFPFLKKSRGGTTSNENGYFKNAFLNVEVLGAEQGKYYRVAFFQNGNVAEGSDGYGWIFEEFDAATYESNPVANRLRYYTDGNGSNTVIQPNTGIKTVIIPAVTNPNILFKITLDTAYLPASGSAVAASNSTAAGYSWIIDPASYTSIVIPDQNLEVELDDIYYNFDSNTGQLNYAYRSGNYYYRVWFGHVGYNNLPNFYRIDKAEASVDLHNAEFIQVMSTTTDFLPPMRFSVITNGDAGSEISTGGNHGADGASGGGQTARNKLFRLFVDGQLLINSRSGYAKSIKAIVINEIMAWNTITLGRYPIEQSFNIDFSGKGAIVKSKVTAKEDLKVTVDNGLQSITGGFNTSQIIANSQYTARKPFDNSASTGSSGAKSTYPNADVLVLRHYNNGDFITWKDKSFGVGDGRYVSSSSPLIQIRGSTKFYSVQIYGGYELSMKNGDFYEWRGGYLWASTKTDVNFDTVFNKNDGVYMVENSAKGYEV